MINRNKKGFTIVELVIVIAVIAILAAVLIPTFAGIIKKANLSSDQQAVRNMNVALAASGDLEGIDAAIDALSENGFNAADTLVPVSKGYAFYWFETANTVLLVEMTEGENPVPKAVVYPEDETLATDFMAASDDVRHNLKGAVKYLNAVVTDAKSFGEAIENGQMEIKLDADVAIEDTLYIPKNANITLDLNGKKLDASKNRTRPLELRDGASLTVNAEGATVDCGKYGLINVPSGASATVVVNGGTFNANLDNGAFIKVRPGAKDVNITLNNVTYTDASDDSFIVNTDGFDGTMTLVVNGGSFTSEVGFNVSSIKIDGATINTKAYAFEIYKNGEISNCTITTGSAEYNSTPAIAVAVSGNGKATVTNCTITADVYALAILPSDGNIEHKGNTITKGDIHIWDGVTGTITEMQ
jgi:prepilin-type N-terminal cleavage/methylation domain-containing protein